MSGAVQAAQPVVLAPSSKWVVDYAEQKCRLFRSFGAGDQLAILYLEQSYPSERFGLTVAGPPLRGFAFPRPVMLRFNESDRENRTTPFTGNIEKVGPALIYSSIDFDHHESADFAQREDDGAQAPGLPEIARDQAARVRFLEFHQGGKTVRFETGEMAAPSAALNACALDLLRVWGLDPERQKAATRSPEWTNRDEVVRRITAKYPGGALAFGEQGIVRMRVMVGANGDVTDCQLERATSAQSLESPACKEMQRAKFNPARDRDGKPMPSYYATTIVYRMASP
jgi:TonB family protein